jgi:hypothetical protein
VKEIVMAKNKQNKRNFLKPDASAAAYAVAIRGTSLILKESLL